VRFSWDCCSLVPVAPSATTAASATAISAVASTTASTSAGALSFGTCFVDVDRASTYGRAIQSRDRLLTVFITGHLDETETSGTSRVSIRHDAYAIYLSERLKQLAQFVLGCVEAQVPYENILHASASALSCRKCKRFGGLGRSGGPFLKIDTGAGEQSNAPSSIAGFPKSAC
jgi:hypothetical protein